MNRLGILVDVSHCGEATGLGAMEASSKPVVVTHSFCNVLSPHIRAKSDDFLKALAAQGGVLGITTLSGFLHYPDEPGRRPDLTRFVEHVSHIAELVGVDHVAIATDYDETWTQEMRIAQLADPNQVDLLPGFGWTDRRAIGMDDAGDFANFTPALLDGGFSPAEVTKILGQNWLRVFDQAWKA